MISFIQGNLLTSDAEALVNTVNTVGVMGKGIALMFKDNFPNNFRAYEIACKAKTIDVGHMLAVKTDRLGGPKWVINFPTKKHWRQPSKLEWIQSGLEDLKRVLIDNEIKSVALPPLGSGNGGLDWPDVKFLIIRALEDLQDVRIVVYEPTQEYQNIAKRKGVERLTPARALVAELVRRYSILVIDCSLLEIHKLSYFLERKVEALGAPSLDLRFQADRYGPYAPRLSHLLDSLDGSYLHCDKRLGDAGPFDAIRFDDAKRDIVAVYMTTPEAKPYRGALEQTSELIDGFQSPLGMELLATVDWLMNKEGAGSSVESIIRGLRNWPGGGDAGARKLKLFDDRMIDLALKQLGVGARGQENA